MMIENIFKNTINLGINSKYLKFVKSLHNKKNIILNNKFLIEGKKNVLDSLLNNHFINNVESIILADIIDDNYLQKISFIKNYEYVKIYKTSYEIFKKISGDETPEGILCVAKILSYNLDEILNLTKKQIFILLDNINDPGNLGTIIRIADNFSISAIFVTKNSVFEYLHKVVKASMGSFTNIPIFRLDEKNYQKVLDFIIKQEVTILYPNIKNGNLLKDVCKNLTNKNIDKLIIIGGSESHGVKSNEIINLIQKSKSSIGIKIPCYGKNESLNLSVAVGITCYEIANLFFENKV